MDYEVEITILKTRLDTLERLFLKYQESIHRR